MASGKPISPDEVTAAKTGTIPGEVFDAFNECIALKWNGHEAVVPQDTVVAAILGRMPTAARQSVFDNGWLDVEESYRALGWSVEYDKPAYNESYPATFKFRKRK